jgi:hypothetical protein
MDRDAMKSICAAVCLFLLLNACTREAPQPAEPPPAAAPPAAAAVEAAYVNDVVGFSLALPDEWKGRYLVDELEGEGRGQPGAHQVIEFRYTPEDASLDEQLLLTVLVYDRDAWGRHAQEAGPSAGHVLGEQGDRVYVARLPLSNPYDAATQDAQHYENLMLSPGDVQQMFAAR